MKVKDIIQEARSPEEFMSQLHSTAPDIKQVYQKYLKSPHYRPFRTSDDDTREYQIWTDNFAQFLRKEFGHMPQDLAFEIGNHLYDYIKMRNREDPEGVAENRTISRPNDPSIAIKRFTAYVQRNINDLASMVEFTLQQKNEPYIDDKFVNYLIKADGTPVTPVFNGGGDVELLGPQKNYLNIPVLKFSYYRGFMYGGDLINQIREQLGYKTKGMAEGSLQEFAPGNGGGDGRWYTDDEIADIIGEDWFEFDLSGEAANISQHGEHAKILLVQEAQTYFEDKGYHGVVVEDVRDDEDYLSWYISGNFTRSGVAEGIFDFKKQSMPEHGDELKIGDRYVIFDDGGSYYGVSWIKQDRSEAYEEFNKSEYTNLNQLKKAIWDEIKYQDQRGVAEGSLNEGQYEMMMRNGQVKKFIAKDDADAKRIAAGHGAKSVIRLKGGVPAGKVSEQGVAEGKKSDRYHIVGKDGKPADLASYPDRASAEQVRDKKYPDAVVQQVGPRGKVKGVTEQAQICSECGGPSYSNPMLAEKKDACYHKVKSRVKVWPSAYASGQLVQCRKRGASNWGTGGKKK